MASVRTNVSFSLDATQLRDFDRRLARVGKAFDKPVVRRVLRQALKPTLAAVKRNAPVGPKRTFRSATRIRGSRRGTSRPSYEARRGGFTRKDTRILVVDGTGEALVNGLVGISKKGDKSGYRTHFITRANAHNRTPNDFLARSEHETERQVYQDFGQASEAIVTRILTP